MPARGDGRVVYRNRTAAFAWGVSAAFLLVVAAMTYLLFRDGPPPGHPMPVMAVILAVFWLGGLGLAAYVAGKPCLTVTVTPGASMVVVERFPFRRRERRFASADVDPARVIESRDDDGEPYFLAQAGLQDGTRLDLYEGHDRERCASVCESFNRARSG